MGGGRNSFEEIMAKNFSNMKTHRSQTLHETQAQEIRRNAIPRHVIIKFLKTSDKEKTLKAARETHYI